MNLEIALQGLNSQFHTSALCALALESPDEAAAGEAGGEQYRPIMLSRPVPTWF